MTPPAQALLATFEDAATAAAKAEANVRRRAEAEIAAAERERAFAYRRLNLMRALVRAIAPAETEEAAVDRGLAAIRSELGWESDSDTRTETLGRLAPVVGATFAGLMPTEEDTAPDAMRTLGEFEAWYARAYGRQFWALFEQEIEEMPLVER